MLPFAPILAADIGGLIALVFLIISFIGWISNLVSGQQQADKGRQQPRPPRRPQDKRIRDEIDAFLQEAGGGQRAGGRPQAGRPDDLLSAEDVEAPAPRPRKAPPKTKPQTRPQPPSRRVAPATSSAPPVEAGPESRRVGENSLGAGLQQHVREHMADRIAAQVQQDLPSGVAQSVSQHMAGTLAAPPAAPVVTATVVRRPPSPAAEILKSLKGPAGMRQAIIFHEILQRPKSLRR